MNRLRALTGTLLTITAVLISLVGMNGCGRVEISLPSEQRTLPPSKSPEIREPTQRAYKINGKTYQPIPDAQGFSQRGLASWYGPPFHGRKTSNGETYNMFSDTAAHKTLPMETLVLVQNMENNRETVVRINDRGPFVKGRIIDLSKKAAKKIGILKNGTARVKITALGETAAVKKDGEKIRRFLPHPDFRKGNFYIQVGSFQDKKNGLRLKKKLSDQGMAPVLVPFHLGKRLFHRVQVPGGKTLSRAEKKKGDLAAEFPGAFVIRKD